MPQKRHSVDQIVSQLRRADVELGNGKNGLVGRVGRVLTRLRIPRRCVHNARFDALLLMPPVPTSCLRGGLCRGWDTCRQSSASSILRTMNFA